MWRPGIMTGGVPGFYKPSAHVGAALALRMKVGGARAVVQQCSNSFIGTVRRRVKLALGIALHFGGYRRLIDGVVEGGGDVKFRLIVAAAVAWRVH